MAFKCVPLNDAWTGDTKQDMRAIYKRPNGDLTTALPLRRHHNWLAKGFQYVTLADAESFALAVPFIRQQGLNPQDFVAGIDGDGRPICWKASAYVADQRANQADADADLRQMVAEFGVEVVERIKGIRVPDYLRGESVAPAPDEAVPTRRKPGPKPKVQPDEVEA